MCILALNAYQAFNMISGVRKPVGGLSCNCIWLNQPISVYMTWKWSYIACFISASLTSGTMLP